MPTPSHLEPVAERYPALEEQDFILTYCAPEARSVQVAGTFNGWRPELCPLAPTGTGDWTVRLKLKSGQYEYRFVVDGRWADDPQAAQSVPNPHGGRNSVLLVGLDDRSDLL